MELNGAIVNQQLFFAFDPVGLENVDRYCDVFK